jgi:hypothetical protein
MEIQIPTLTRQANKWLMIEPTSFSWSDFEKKMGNQIARPIAPNNMFEINPSARAKTRSNRSDIISKRIWTQMINVHIPR